ncbi:MAG: 50S ribosomal protein L25 [Alphaproteobacteria bacterium MarineAlpha9_Bin4]|nr:50S ribosomal protein L25/general stress protein Ctc [Pelagibacterales bacterium]PPR27205.1 MAG: 50S ribosomal protein L25 [Alphaproteobacteria bacterium MarineAlpha9_Bin4]|tara:strand:- start:1919 stop:2605 length:687 start_codon:yes stop_codon:yes gene_type:complete
MKDISILNAFSRKNVGTNGSKKVRQENKIPAIIYGDGKNPQAISLEIKDLRTAISKSSFINKIYDLSIDKSKTRVIVQDISQNPVTERLEHIDFLRVNDDTKVTIEVPVKFINEALSPGLKRGGVLNVVRYTVEVVCPVKSIPENFEFNLEGLEIGDSIHISHTKMNEEIKTTITDRDFTVASILAPSALVSAEATEEKTGEEGTETEETEENKDEEKTKENESSEKK